MGSLPPLRVHQFGAYLLELAANAKVARKTRAGSGRVGTGLRPVQAGHSPASTPERKSTRHAAVSGARDVSRRSSSMRWRTYPSSLKWAEAMALRLLATIWSSGRRWGNCGSSSRQNSQGRLERVSKRLMTAGSMCSTKSSSWGRRERIRPVCEAESQYSASDDSSICLNDAFVLQGKGPDKPFVGGANFLSSQ